jgi:endo-1,4-beta-D-glucanase Y
MIVKFPRLSLAVATLGLLASTAAAQNFPFPQHAIYAAGIKPSNVSQSSMDTTVSNFWNTYRSRYVKSASTGGYYIAYNLEGQGDSGAATVSEAHGYGMVLCAYMNDKTHFDGMYTYYKNHPSQNNSKLMAWQQNTSFADMGGADSATDGDMDIAYSLLIADKQWGSAGTINYLQAATNMINALMQSDVNQSQWTLRLGDWATTGSAGGFNFSTATRPSDFMFDHMWSYYEATHDARWTNVIFKTYAVVNQIFANNSPNTGLIPDFVVLNGSTYQPAPANFLEGANDGKYDYNSCRTPWRFATEYMVRGSSGILTEMRKMNSWIQSKSGGNPDNVFPGYSLSGTALDSSYTDDSFTSPFGVSAMTDSANQAWLNSLWSWIAARGINTGDGYFGNSITMQCVLVMSGNWWKPVYSGTPPPPDFTVSATPASQTITAGDSTTFTVNVGNVNGFVGGVALSVSGLPTGATATFTPPSVNPPGSSTLTVTTSAGTPAGTSTLTITGTGGSLTHSTTVSLAVNAGGVSLFEAENLAFTTNGATATLNTDANASGGAWLLLNSTATGRSITYTTPSLPAGTYGLDLLYKKNTTRGIHSVSIDGQASIATVDQYASANSFATITLGSVTFASAGTHTIKLSVTGKNASSTSFTVSADAFRFTQQAPPPPDFTLGASPSSQTVTVGNSTTYTVTIGAQNGFSGTVALAASGLPAGATATFNPTSITGSGTSTLTVSTATSTPATTSTVTITGTSGSLSHSANVSLVTQPQAVADFSISASPTSQSVTAGGSTTYTVTISAINGFSGTVTLSATGLPSGASASFNPATIAGSGSSTVTITTSASTPAGTSTVTLTGTSGSLTHSAPVSLSVTTAISFLKFEAESLAVTTNGAVMAATQIDANASAGAWSLFNGNSTGDWVQFTVPNVPAGTYSLRIDFKKNNNRGIIQVSVDGVNLGSTIDQYASPSVYTSSAPGNVTFATAGNHTIRLTVTGKNASSSSFTVAADVFTLTPTSAPPPTVVMEAESLAFTVSGATTQVTTDANASGGAWLQVNSDGVGDFIDLTTTSLPVGTYQVQFKYKTNTTRGQHTVSIDGAQVGGTIDQYSATVSYPTATLGTVTFSAEGTHTIRLQVTGKNASASNFLMSADAFVFVGQ